MTIFLVLFLIFELYFLSRILRFFIISPIYLYVIYSLLCIVLSIWYFYCFDNKFSIFQLDYVSEAPFLHVIQLYILALVSFLAGIIIYYDLSTKKTKKLLNKSYMDSLFIQYNIPEKTKYIVIVLFLIIVILYLITYGKGIFIRQDYIPERNKGLTIIIKIASFIEALLLGLIYKKNKIISTVFFVLLILISIGTGSRTVFMFFILYVFLIFISSENTLLNKIRFSSHLFISLFLLAYIMQLRGLRTHGIIPYLKSIGSSSNDFYRSFFFNIYYSFIYGVFVTIRTFKEAKLDWHIIWINVNPLPGFMTGWYDYANKMRINIYAPFSLHGRVFKTGLIFTISYFFITGLIFSYFEKKIRMLLNNGNKILSFILVIILVLHIVYAFEYNMRSAVRYFYYAYFIVFVTYLFKEFVKNLPKNKKEI